MTEQRVAVVGAGNWGKNIIRVCHELGVLASICDHDEHKIAHFTQAYGVINQSWQEILLDPNITSIAIVVPAKLHPKFIKEALLANKHVFVEKPLANDYATAKELCQLARSHNRVLMVGHILQYHSAYVRLKELLATDQIGKVRYIESTRLHLGPVRYHDGIIWELLPHDISMVLGIVGLQEDAILEMIISDHNFTTNQDDNEFHNKIDLLDVNLKFHNGIKARVCTSWLYPKKEQRLTVIGTKGALIFEDTLYWNQKLKLCQYDTATMLNIDLARIEPLKAELSHFIDCTNKGTVPVTDGYEAAKVTRILEQIEINLKKQTAVIYEQN